VTREEIIARNPIAQFVRSRGHELKLAGQNFVTNACPQTQHKRGHRPVMIYPETQSWSCHDCKRGGSVIDWVMIEGNVTAAEAMRILGGGNNSSPELVATYDYTDESGNLLYQTCRYQPKDFRQRRPDGKGGWIWNLDGARRVLYRLPEVLKAQTVCVAEGEKDCNNLAKLGFVATTNPLGAGKWRDECSETLRGKDVIVFGDVGDDDGAGERHTNHVIESLVGKAKSIKHVALPDGFHDVSDYIASLPHETVRDAIAKLIEETPTIEAQSQEAPEPPPSPTPYVPPPLDLFPDEVQRFIRAGAATYDVDRAFFVLPVLSGAAAMIGNSRSIRLKEDYIEPSIIWTATIAPTGDGKSPVLQAATAPVRMREIGLIKKNKDADKKFTEESAKWDAKTKKERAGGEKPEKPALLTCWLDDATTEAVALRLNNNPRGALLPKDEFSHWFESMDQYHDRGGADVSRWLSIWTGHLFALDRVTGNRSYRITNPRLSITGGIVPDKYQHLLTDDFFVRGLPARFCFAMPTRNQPRKWVDKDIPKEVKAAVNELFARLAELPAHKNEHDEELPELLGLTPEAKEIFVEFYNECARRAFEADVREAAQWSKLSAYSARLALVGQLMRDPDAEIVTADTMQAACDLARWFGNEAERIYALIAETPEQRADRKLVGFIERNGGTVRVRDLMQSYRPLKNKREEAETTLNRLVAAGHGEWIETRGERGPAAREFQLLQVSTSTGLGISPSIAPKPVDVDSPGSQENTPSGERELAAEKEPSLPVMITKRMEADLQTMGYSQADIDKMTPAQANDILAGKPVGVPGDESGVARL
jgi:5S rRNA maturation endonuclease (ribonuclease M5)